MNVLGTISIPFDPYIIGLGPFLFSWHGFFTVVGVAWPSTWSISLGLSKD